MARKLSRRALLWGLGATGAVGLSGVLWRARTTWGATEPIKIGLLMSFSGVVAAWGRAGRQGLRMAVEELNGQGGVLGRQPVMKAEDDTVNGEVAVRKARRLVLDLGSRPAHRFQCQRGRSGRLPDHGRA